MQLSLNIINDYLTQNQYDKKRKLLLHLYTCFEIAHRFRWARHSNGINPKIFLSSPSFNIARYFHQKWIISCDVKISRPSKPMFQNRYTSVAVVYVSCHTLLLKIKLFFKISLSLSFS